MSGSSFKTLPIHSRIHSTERHETKEISLDWNQWTHINNAMYMIVQCAIALQCALCKLYKNNKQCRRSLISKPSIQFLEKFMRHPARQTCTPFSLALQTASAKPASVDSEKICFLTNLASYIKSFAFVLHLIYWQISADSDAQMENRKIKPAQL